MIRKERFVAIGMLSVLCLFLIPSALLVTNEKVQSNLDPNPAQEPGLIYSTFFGGSGDDYIRAMKRDNAHNLIIVGYTSSTDLPVQNGNDSSYNGGTYDMFLAKFDPSGQLLWSTYYGGSSEDQGLDVAIDASNNIYAVGYSTSTDIPLFGAYDSSPNGGQDLLVLKITPEGVPLWATCIGGSGNDVGYSIVVNPSGDIYLTGRTTSSNFPTLNATGTTLGAGFAAVIVRLNSDGALVMSTYFGDTYDCFDICVDAVGNYYISGSTYRGNYPLINAERGSTGSYDFYFARFNSSNNQTWGTYLGGNGNDPIVKINVDASGNVYFAGETQTSNFPCVNAFSTTYMGGTEDTVYGKYNSSGQLVFSTYVSSSGYDSNPNSPYFDAAGNMYAASIVGASDFPAVNVYNTYNGGSADGVILKFSPTGDLLWDTFIGGTNADGIMGLVYEDGVLFGGLHSYSPDFPIVGNSWDSTYNSGLDTGLLMFVENSTNPPVAPVLNAIDPNPSTTVNVSLIWNEVELATSYNVYRATQYITVLNGTVTNLGSTSNLYFEDYNVTNGAWYYAITAVNSYGESEISNCQAVVVAIPQVGLIYSTYFGGSGDDYIASMKRDCEGNLIVIGYTTSTDLPVLGGNDSNYNGGTNDMFVAKFDPAGQLLWSTYYGGSGDDQLIDVAIDASNNIYAVGMSTSMDIPLFGGYDSTPNGDQDIIVLKINATGTVLWATCIGGSGVDSPRAIDLTPTGEVFFAGITYSSDLPMLNAYDSTKNTAGDGMIAKMSSTGALLMSTYFGGNNGVEIHDISVDSDGNYYIAGPAWATNLPLINAYMGATGTFDFYFGCFNATNALTWGSYLGGTGNDPHVRIQIDDAQNVYFAGNTQTSNFPCVNAFDTAHHGGTADQVFGKFNSTRSLVWSTYVGSTGYDEVAASFCIDAAGNMYAAGIAGASDYPAVNAYDGSYNGGTGDGVILKFSPTGELLWNTFLGGSASEGITALMLDGEGICYGSIASASSDFPMVGNSWNNTYSGGNEGILFKFAENVTTLPAAPVLNAINPNPSITGNVSLTWDAVDFATSYNVYRSAQYITELNETATNLGNTTNLYFEDNNVTDGTWYYAIIAVNEFGKSEISNCQSVVVNITEPVLGLSLTHPANIVIDPAATGQWITWTATDGEIIDPTYVITLDGTTIQEGTWSNGGAITTCIDGIGIGAHMFIVTAYDGTGEFASDSVQVMVDASPQVSSPSDVFSEVGESGAMINWTIIDLAASNTTYTVTCNGTIMQNGTWMPGQSIVVNVSCLVQGYYMYTLTAWEDGGSASDEVQVIVNAPPQLSSPFDVIIQASAAGNVITWTVTDTVVLDPTYAITQDGTVIQQGTWVSGGSITTNIDGMGEGSYTLALTAWDGYAVNATDEVQVIVNKAPQVSSPSDMVVNVGSPAPNINWTAMDATILNATYSVTRDGTVMQAGMWANGNTILVNTGNLTEGSYVFVLALSDGYGGHVTDAVTVVANVPPQLTTPVDILYQVNTTGHSISWTIVDATASDAAYIIEENGTIAQEDSWTSGQIITLSVDGLTPGYYVYNLTVADGYGDVMSDFVQVTVNAQPQLTSPADIFYEMGTTGHMISWVAVDNTTGTPVYTIYRNGTLVQGGNWANGNPIIVNVDGLASGTFAYEIRAHDGYGPEESDVVLVTVNAIPQLSSPADLLYEVGTTGHAIEWTVTDAITGSTSYAVFRNGTCIQNGTWVSGGTIPVTVDGLAAGRYSFNITVGDGFGDTVSDTVEVTVNAPPQVSNPPNVIYEIGTTGHVIAWTATDATIGNTTYAVYRNGTLVQTGTWASGVAITINIDGIAAGRHVYNLTVTDGYGDTASDFVLVTVNAPPQLTSPADLFYESGTTGHVVTWVVTDTTTGSATFSILRNWTLVQNGTWVDGNAIAINVDGLTQGSWTYTLTVRDGYDDLASDTILVGVNTPPQVTNPPNMVWESGTTGHIVSWVVTDETTGAATYTLLQNGTVVASGSWTSGQTISHSGDGLGAGYYALTLVVDDGCGDSVNDTVLLTVNAPPQLSSPADLLYEVGTTGQLIAWNVSDATTMGTTYLLVRNGTLVQNGTWSSGGVISINVDGLTAGYWVYTLTVRDGYGDVASDIVLVTVNAPPKITRPANISYKVGTTGHVIRWTPTDATTSNATYTITRNGVVVATGTWTTGTRISINVDGLAIGTYEYVITISDGNGDSTSDSVRVQVKK